MSGASASVSVLAAEEELAAPVGEGVLAGTICEGGGDGRDLLLWD